MGDHGSRRKPTDEQLTRIIAVARKTALRLGANDAEADEVAQSTVVRFWLRWDIDVIRKARSRTGARWDGYVRRSAVNIYRNRIREHQRRLYRQQLACTSEVNVSYRPGTSALTRVAPCPIEELLARTVIAKEIERLPTEKQRTIARAVFVHGKSTAEVAKELGIQPQAVRKHLRPAREQLTIRLDGAI